jgi:nicotinamidase-related amidase
MASKAEIHVPSSTPYPWPWNGDLGGSGTAVAIIAPRNRIPEPQMDVLTAIHDVVTAVKAIGGLAILVTTRPPSRKFDPGTSDFDPGFGLDPATLDHTVHADGIDGFCGSPLEGLLHSRGISRIVLVGAALETSVHSTMRSANDRGFECLLVIDASAPLDSALVDASISMIEMSGGIFGAVAKSTDVISALRNVLGD